MVRHRQELLIPTNNTLYYVQDLDTRSPCLFRAGETRLCRQQEAKGICMCVYNTGRLLAWVQLDCLAAEEGACQSGARSPLESFPGR